VSKHKVLAFLAYLLSVLGWLYVLLFQREDKLAVYHAKQSLVLTLVAIGSLAIWLLGSWAISWVPLVGPLIAAVVFSQIILLYIFLGAAWIMGMVYALQAKIRPLPLVGKWAERIPG
jgi:uncharacterized membrane protein